MNRFKQAIQDLEEMRQFFPAEWKRPIQLDKQISKDFAKIQKRMKQVPAEG